MKEVKVLIVDDEPIARDIIATHVSKIPNWQIVASSVNAYEAYDALHNQDVDVIFLDIEMPKISGIDFLRSLSNPPLVVFTTAYSEYALKSYELNVIDYLLKPIVFERFSQAVQKVNDRLKSNDSMFQNEGEETYAFFKCRGKLVKILFDDIEYVKAEQEYSYVFTKTEKYLLSMHLKMLQEILPPGDFLRIHRSYIVSKSKISSIEGNTVHIGKSSKIPISKSSKANLLASLKIKNEKN